MNYKQSIVCPSCNGSTSVSVIFSKFDHVEYGHAICNSCGITFDTNVADTLNVKLLETEIEAIGDEREYRDLFIETSRIATESGEIYPSFDW
ncbi:hypothetical protein RSSM_02049 [Rhodopirellula sallentina SM41]|uniref:Uncharacterized protein n=1 Tax=Rhodopirellula sallentina SM41 TaxID=1263870 RepID=M5U4Y0_9BACT|nr:hypothetical protein RSSM_02049 [Rhodopirellula sallentina SM41]